MAVPTGTASLANIQSEFGGSNPIQLSEYYGAASGVPTSGEISVDDFRGKASGTTITVSQSSSPPSKTSPGTQYGYGYNGGSTYGSRSPTSFSGATINTLAFSDATGSWQFSVALAGNRAKSFFTSATPQGGSTLNSSSASHSYNSSTGWTWWTWTTSKPSVWDGSGNVTVVMV